MRTRSKLLPGQKGAKALQEKYGEAFVCVRYRYDERKRKQYKTVEIIVSEKDWTPPQAKFPESTIVPLRIGAAEKKLQAEVKAINLDGLYYYKLVYSITNMFVYVQTSL